jgi:hypothetical protein
MISSVSTSHPTRSGAGLGSCAGPVEVEGEGLNRSDKSGISGPLALIGLPTYTGDGLSSSSSWIDVVSSLGLV